MSCIIETFQKRQLILNITVTRRNPDVRISGFSKIIRFPNRRDFRQRLITGRLCSVIGRSVHSLYSVRLSDVRFQPENQFQTGLEPVLDLECLKSGHKRPDFRHFRHIRKPDVRSMNRTFEIRTIDNRTLFRPVCQTGGPVLGAWLYMYTICTYCTLNSQILLLGYRFQNAQIAF